eukprot:1536272-Rhodomonas_salina.3
MSSGHVALLASSAHCIWAHGVVGYACGAVPLLSRTAVRGGWGVSPRSFAIFHATCRVHAIHSPGAASAMLWTRVCYAVVCLQSGLFGYFAVHQHVGDGLLVFSTQGAPRAGGTMPIASHNSGRGVCGTPALEE